MCSDLDCMGYVYFWPFLNYDLGSVKNFLSCQKYILILGEHWNLITCSTCLICIYSHLALFLCLCRVQIYKIIRSLIFIDFIPKWLWVHELMLWGHDMLIVFCGHGMLIAWKTHCAYPCKRCLIIKCSLRFTIGFSIFMECPLNGIHVWDSGVCCFIEKYVNAARLLKTKWRKCFVFHKLKTDPLLLTIFLTITLIIGGCT